MLSFFSSVANHQFRPQGLLQSFPGLPKPVEAFVYFTDSMMPERQCFSLASLLKEVGCEPLRLEWEVGTATDTALISSTIVFLCTELVTLVPA